MCPAWRCDMTDNPADRRAYRLSAIDMLRGLVIVIMAIDHVRDFFLVGAEQDPMANPNITAGLFATRWITHFCAPVFVLLAGTSAGLMTARKSPAELARFPPHARRVADRRREVRRLHVRHVLAAAASRSSAGRWSSSCR